VICRWILSYYGIGLFLRQFKSPSNDYRKWPDEKEESYQEGQSILIVSGYTKSIAPYAEETRRINENYAKKYNYGYLNYVVTIPTFEVHVDKLEHISMAMALYPEYEYEYV